MEIFSVYEQKISDSAPYFTVVDTLFHPPRFRARGFLGYANGPWTAQLSVNYTDGYENPLEPGAGSVDSWTTLDLSVGLSFDDSPNEALRGLNFSLSAQNITDEDPPFVPLGAGSTLSAPIGYDPVNANPLGRVITLRASKRW